MVFNSARTGLIAYYSDLLTRPCVCKIAAAKSLAPS